jgi:redox-sensitive bicupin YhaK (pirin superfamily)
MLDYAEPAQFTPASRPRGVGQHPHRGFETVTIVYQGELEHRDSTGSGGLIGAGDVQWMTAASGILHEEFHSEEFTRTGGTLEMVQLWVNLPAKDKMAAPGYQTLLDANIPSVTLPDGAGTVRVIAGDFEGHRGPARTFTSIDVWDMRLTKGGLTVLVVPENRTLAIVVLHGSVTINGDQEVHDAQTAILGREGVDFTIEANRDSVVLVLSGEPIDEPVVSYGPFVMNTAAEIQQAAQDFNNGRFGRMRTTEPG